MGFIDCLIAHVKQKITKSGSRLVVSFKVSREFHFGDRQLELAKRLLHSNFVSSLQIFRFCLLFKFGSLAALFV